MEATEPMKSDRLVIAAVLFLAAGLWLVLGFTHGATSLNVGYPFPENKLHADITTVGLPALLGVPLLAAGALLLFFAFIAAIVSQFRRPQSDLVAAQPAKRREPFADAEE
jgi:ABC-type Na+ efflux pump permease subunit